MTIKFFIQIPFFWQYHNAVDIYLLLLTFKKFISMRELIEFKVKEVVLMKGYKEKKI